MSKKFCAMLLAPVFLFASIQNALAMDGTELVAKLDTAAPKFNTDGCKSARNTMAQYDGHIAERVLEGTLMLALFGGIFAVPAALSQGGQEDRIANYLVQNLQTECGRQALFPIYLEAANKGEAPAQAWIARAYETGDGAARDPAQAIDWYQKAADQGFADAMVSLGNVYFASDGVPADEAHAVALWQKAADGGSLLGKAKLGEAYYDGRGVGQDYSRAVALWLEAMRKNDPTALAYFGKALLEGKAVAPNYLAAQEAFRGAAWNGSALAQYELGYMYETGMGLQHSDADAYRWYAVSDMNGYAQAKSKRQELAAKLTPENVRSQDMAADTCVKSQFTNCR